MSISSEYEPSGCLSFLFIFSIWICFIYLPIGLFLVLAVAVIGCFQRMLYIFKNKNKKTLVKIPLTVKPAEQPEEVVVDYKKCFALLRSDEDRSTNVVYVDHFGSSCQLSINSVFGSPAFNDPSFRRIRAIKRGGLLIEWGLSYKYGSVGVVYAPHDGVYSLIFFDLTDSANKGKVIIKHLIDESFDKLYKQQEEQRMAVEKEEQERRELRMSQMRMQREIEEKEQIANKLKERHRKKELEKIIRQELIDNGELFGEQAKRPPISAEVRDVVYRRDGGRCVECGSTENLQFDHIIPFSKGGATSVENLQILCQKCNLEKSNKIG